MKGQRIVFVLIVLALLTVAIWSGLRGEKAEIVIGGKGFTEQTIIGEMAAQLIEEKAGLAVERRFHLQSNLPMKMLRKGEIDLYLDYTGTGYMDILGLPYRQEPREEIYAHVKKVYSARFDAEWLSPLGFDNTYTLTMRRRHAEELGVAKISDLASHKSKLRAGFNPAFLDRDDGYPGLAKHYAFEFAATPRQLAIGLMYRACREGEIDVIDAFSTDGRIGKFDLLILEDDKHFFPPYDAAFVVRGGTLRKHPKVREVLELLAGRIDNATMQRLNYTVDEEGRREAEVAREFLLSMRLIQAGEGQGG
jgi:glycine betaine/choline ABC-type transport system substrate-binding protein